MIVYDVQIKSNSFTYSNDNLWTGLFNIRYTVMKKFRAPVEKEVILHIERDSSRPFPVAGRVLTRTMIDKIMQSQAHGIGSTKEKVRLCEVINNMSHNVEHYFKVLKSNPDYNLNLKHQTQGDFESMSALLPGYKQLVIHPIWRLPARLGSVIINLNDQCKWSRDQIADWLDTLHDSGTIDLSFADRTEENKDCQTRKSENK